MKQKIIKQIIFIFLIILFIDSVYALRLCQTVQEPDQECEILTPIIVGCSTYDLYNPLHNLIIDDGGMSEIGNTGVFNFTFKQSAKGAYKLILCENTTASFEVADYSLKNIGNTTLIAQGVWDLNLSERYPSADDDNYVSTLAGQQMLQTLRFILQIIFGGY